MGSENGLNIPSVPVETLIHQLKTLFCNVKKRGIAFKSIPTPFLWGPPGVGKSQAVYQVADILSKECNVKVNVIDVRLLLFSPIDLRGVPVADADRKFTDWLKPRIFDMEDGDDVINILFLDELSAASQAVQAAAYQICLDRKIGEHILPENCIVIAAGNRTTDQSVSYKMPKALCNRLMHFDVVSNYASWKRWAVQKGISEKVIAFIGFDNSRLCVEPDSSELAYPTPRSWEFVSNLLNSDDGDPAYLNVLISACVGSDTAMEFDMFCKGFLSLPSVQSIMKGLCREYPKSHDKLYALSASIVSVIRDRKADITKDELNNIFDYVKGFPHDYVVALIYDVLQIDGIKSKLMTCYSFQKLAAKNKIAV